MVHLLYFACLHLFLLLPPRFRVEKFFEPPRAALSSEPQRVDCCIRSLNRLAAPSRFAMHERPQPPATVVQSDVHDRVMSAVAAAGPPAEGPVRLRMTPESALADMMASKTVYNAEPANLALFSLEKLKVCKRRIRPQPLLQFLPEHAKFYLKFLFN